MDHKQMSPAAVEGGHEAPGKVDLSNPTVAQGRRGRNGDLVRLDPSIYPKLGSEENLSCAREGEKVYALVPVVEVSCSSCGGIYPVPDVTFSVRVGGGLEEPICCDCIEAARSDIEQECFIDECDWLLEAGLR